MGVTAEEIESKLLEFERLRSISVEDCKNPKLLPMCKIKYKLQTNGMMHGKRLMAYKIIDFIYRIDFTKIELVNSTVFEKNFKGEMWAAPTVRLHVWLDNSGYTSFEIIDDNTVKITDHWHYKGASNEGVIVEWK